MTKVEKTTREKWFETAIALTISSLVIIGYYSERWLN